MFHAGIASRSIGLFSIEDHADAALIALHFAAVSAVGHEHRVLAVALYSSFAEQFVAIGTGCDFADFDQFVGTVVADSHVGLVVDAVVVFAVGNAVFAVAAVVLMPAVGIDICRAAAAVRAEEFFGCCLCFGRAFGIDGVLGAALFAPGDGFAPGVSPLPVPVGMGFEQWEHHYGQRHNHSHCGVIRFHNCVFLYYNNVFCCKSKKNISRRQMFLNLSFYHLFQLRLHFLPLPLEHSAQQSLLLGQIIKIV